MNIYAISNNYNPNFGITSKVRIPMKNGTTTLLEVTGDVRKDGTAKITKIIGNIMHKGKSVGQTKEYINENGFSIERFAAISDELSKGAKDEPADVADKIFDSIVMPRIDYNA